MAQWLSSDVTADCLRLHYYRTGGNKPPIVMCHGMTDDGLCWTPVAQTLEQDYDIYMLDARGHGLSEAPAGDYDSATMTVDLAGFIQALHLATPLVVMGHSMGAMTAILAAARYPGLFKAVILEDPPLRDPSPGDNQPRFSPGGVRNWIEGCRGVSREALVTQAKKDNPSWSEGELGPWADSKQRVSDAFIDSFLTPRSFTPLVWEALEKITSPVLLLTGDPEKGAIINPAGAEKAVKILPSLKVAHIPGVGHNIRREGFTAYMKAVKLFLSEL